MSKNFYFGNLSKNRKQKTSVIRTLGICATLITASHMLYSCGATKESEARSLDGTATATKDRIIVPPKQYYDSLLAKNMNLASQGSLTKQDQVLWLNFQGATVKYGYNDGESFIPCKDSVSIPASKFSIADQKEIANEVAKYFSNAGVKLNITFDRPAFGDFTTMHIGGSYANLECSGGAGILGIAPYDVGNANPNDIGFTFTASNSDLNSVAETIAHESGHSFGLDHTNNRQDIMYPVESSNVIGFTKGIAESSQQEQDGPIVLQQNLSSGTATVNGSPISPTSTIPIATTPTPTVQSPTTSSGGFSNFPGSTGTLPGIANLGNINSILNGTSASVFSSLAPNLPSIIASLIPGGCSLPNAQGALGVLSILQNASLGQNNGSFNMGSMITLISGTGVNLPFLSSSSGVNLNSGFISSAIRPLSVPGITTANATSSGINVAQLIGLASMSNPGMLIATLPAYSQLLNANTSGANTQALTSLVMMAVTQQYNAINVSGINP